MSGRMQLGASPTAAEKAQVVIGSRWQPGQIERRDDERGTYEMLNSRMELASEMFVQQLLLGDGRGWIA